MNKLKQTAFSWFYNFLHVQLFLSLMALPVLVAWGLPFSLTTVVGNLLFTPFLFLFLFLSTVLFFSELLQIPNTPLFYLLEKLHTFWLFLLNKGSTQWLYAIDTWGLFFCVGVSLMACIVLHHKQWGREKNSWKVLIPLLLLPFFYQQMRAFFPYQGIVTCIKKKVAITCSQGKISIIDYGALGEKKSAGTWVQYTFLSEIIKRCGSVRFDTITCSYPTVRTLEALATLCNHAPVKRILIAYPGRRSKQYKEQYKQLEATTKKEGIILSTEPIPSQNISQIKL